MSGEAMIDMIGSFPIFHGERGDLDPVHPDACLCGAEDYLGCPEWLDGGGIGSMTIGETRPMSRAIDVAYAALVEIGRHDLALEISGHDDGDGFGFYLEAPDVILGSDDWELIVRAETLARASIGQPPAAREVTS